MCVVWRREVLCAFAQVNLTVSLRYLETLASTWSSWRRDLALQRQEEQQQGAAGSKQVGCGRMAL